MIYGYARVSTKGQEQNGNSLTDQTAKLKAAGCEVIYSEAYTGTKVERPKLTELLGKLVEGDTLVVCKLDRFARTAAEGSLLIQHLVGRGVTVDVLNMGRADGSPMGKLMVTIMLAFAEFERDMIIERTSAGKEVKRADPNWREGRKRLDVDVETYQRQVESGELTVAAACRRLGISRGTWYNRVREH